MWLVIETDNTVEVVPDYGKEHEVGNIACWCSPRTEQYDRVLIIHNVVN